MNEERLKLALVNFQDALRNLEQELETNTGDRKSRNSVLLCFVLTFEACWKALKFALLVSEGLEANSPKSVFRAAFQTGWLGERDTIWLMMSDDRNLVSHTYNESQAIQIFQHVQQDYAPACRELLTLLQAKISEGLQ